MQAVVLAAGKGTRMKSDLPKVLHKLGDKTLLAHVLEHLALFGVAKPIIVIGHQKELVQSSVQADFFGAQFAEQAEPLGTGDAVMAAVPLLESGPTYILMGDAPLFSPSTLSGMAKVNSETKATITLATVHFDDDIAYGRILRDAAGNIVGIVERKNATDEQLKIHEYNAGCYLVDADWLKENLPKVEKNPLSGEYYLTDVIALAATQNKTIKAYPVTNSIEALPVNSLDELQVVEEAWRSYQAD